MSNSNLYGSIDRRKPTTEPLSIQIKDRFDRVYQEMGRERFANMKETEKQTLETAAFHSAFVKTKGADKDNLSFYKSVLIQRIGKSFGDTSAYQVLARIGVLLLEAERAGRL